MSRKKHPPAPSPSELEATITTLVRDALALVMPYRILHRAAYDSRSSGSSVRISGGSESNPTLAAIESKRQEALRAEAASIARRVREAARELDNARTDVGRSVGRQFKQPGVVDGKVHLPQKTTLDESEFKSSYDRRRERLAEGEE